MAICKIRVLMSGLFRVLSKILFNKKIYRLSSSFHRFYASARLSWLKSRVKDLNSYIFKMAVIQENSRKYDTGPLVPETKMADVDKLICFENLLVRIITWFVPPTTSVTLILSRAFGADHMSRISDIYSRLTITHSLTF